jgi:hypothetical protein
MPFKLVVPRRSSRFRLWNPRLRPATRTKGGTAATTTTTTIWTTYCGVGDEVWYPKALLFLRVRIRPRFSIEFKFNSFRQPPTSQTAPRLWLQTMKDRFLRLLRRMRCAERHTETSFLPNLAFEPSTSLSQNYNPSLRLNLMTTERLLATLTISPFKKKGAFPAGPRRISRISAYPGAQAPTAKPYSIVLLYYSVLVCFLNH